MGNHGINCFNGHGAVDIDDKPIVNLTVAGCIERCDADAECSAVVYRQDQQWCWRRAHVRIAECHAAARFDTYVKPVIPTIKLYAAELTQGQAPVLPGFSERANSAPTHGTSLLI